MPALPDAAIDRLRHYRHHGSWAEGWALYQHLCAEGPVAAAVALEGGLLALQHHQWGPASEAFRQVLQEQPGQLNALVGLATCLQQQGQAAQALGLVEEALAEAPMALALWQLRAQLAETTAQPDLLLESLQQALVLATPAQQPALVEQLASAYRQHNKITEATQLLADTLNAPDGVATPAMATQYLGLLIDQRLYGEGLAAARELTQRFPNDATVQLLHAQLAEECAQNDEALASYRQAVALAPEDGRVALAAARHMPVVAQHAEEYAKANQRLHAYLASVPLQRVLSFAQLDDPATRPELNPPFTMAYQPGDLRPLREAYGQWVHTFLSQSSEASALQALPVAPNTTTGQYQVGLLVTRHHEAIFSRLMEGLLTALAARPTVALTLIAPPTSLAYFKKQAWASHIQHWHPLAECFSQAVPAIKALGLDVLHHYEVGTDTEDYLLPWFRLARWQVTGWGFPVTSGLPGLDAVASCAAFEAPEADSHYTETLLRLPGTPGVFRRPVGPAVPRAQWYAAHGLCAESPVVGCLQNLFKCHPAFDAVLAACLSGHPRLQVLLLEGVNPHWTEALMQRLARHLPPEALQRVHWLARQSPQGYIDALAHCTVLVDPLYYGGGSSSLEALGLGTPVVTCPTAQQRGRHTAGFYTLSCRAEVLHAALVATDPQQLAQKVLAYLADASLQQQVAQALEDSVPQWFDNTAYSDALYEHLVAAVPTP